MKLSNNTQSQNHVSQIRTVPVDGNRVKPNAAVEQNASGDAGTVQLWHGHDPSLRITTIKPFSGAVDGKVSGKFAPTFARMVLRCAGQTGSRTAGDRHDRQFRTIVAEGSLVGRYRETVVGLGTGCQQFAPDLHGAGGERGLSRLCHSGGVDDCGGSESGRSGNPIGSAYWPCSIPPCPNVGGCWC